MKYDIAIFDLDGTILYTLEDLTDATNYALRTNALPLRTIEEVRRFVGNGIRKLIERAVPEGSSEELIEKVLEDFNSFYKIHCADKTRPYDGIWETIKKIREMGMRTAVVSNKADYGVQALCEQYFPGLFDFSVGEKEGIKRKPSPDSVLAVLNKFKVDKSRAVYIGDSDVDYATSKNAGVDVIMVSWGFRDEAFLRQCGAELIVNKPFEILEHI